MPHRLIKLFTEGEFISKYLLPTMLGLTGGSGFFFALFQNLYERLSPEQITLLIIGALIVTGGGTLCSALIINLVRLYLGRGEQRTKIADAEIHASMDGTKLSAELIKTLLDDINKRAEIMRTERIAERDHLEAREKAVRDEKHETAAKCEAVNLENFLIKNKLREMGYDVILDTRQKIFDIVKR